MLKTVVLFTVFWKIQDPVVKRSNENDLFGIEIFVNVFWIPEMYKKCSFSSGIQRRSK